MYEDNQDFKELNQIIDEPPVVVRLKVSQVAPLRERITALVASANVGVLEERQVQLAEAFRVAEIAFSRHLLLPNRREIEFKAFRELSNFLEMAISGKSKSIAKGYTDFLSSGHPLSTSPELQDMSQEEVRGLQAEWIASDPRINAELRPVIASAFSTAPNSVERKYAIARVSSITEHQIPREVSLALINAK